MKHCTLVSTYPPTDWGHISFTENLLDALREQGYWQGDLVGRHPSNFGANQQLLVLPDGEIATFSAAGKWIADSDTDIVGLHPDLGHIDKYDDLELTDFLTRLTMPVVTTLHGLGRKPTPPYRETVRSAVYLSDRLVVMTDRAAALVTGEYGVHPSKIDVIPHGVPDLPFVPSDDKKEAAGFADRTVLLTAGFMGPGKGLEFVLETVADLVPQHPEILYLIVGPVHPDLPEKNGKDFRRSLKERVQSLNLTDHVRFLDTIPDRNELVTYMQTCDIYVTPYPGCDESSTGTLAYAIGTGRPVVSTHSPYTEELLANGEGHLLPYGDAVALTHSLRRLVADQEARDILSKRAYNMGQTMTWRKIGPAYAALFDAAARGGRQFEITSDGPHFPISPPPIRWP